ncbi:MAG: glucose-6-phosphate isomerase family protein [Halobacteriota archaeon]
MALKFGKQLVESEIRRLYDLRNVAFDTAWFEDASDCDAYYMYRDLSLTQDDADMIKRSQLRYDITIMPPLQMGLEFVKTYGHYHPRVSEQPGYTYPEVYEVLDGDAHYLLQRADNHGVDEVLLVKATKGDKVIIPPNYGHVTINPSEKTLKMANWVCRSFESLYKQYTEFHGGAYYELINGRLLHNQAYEQVPEIRIVYPKETPECGLVKRKPMYGLIKEPNLLEFLTAPEKHSELFGGLYSR